jgi:hypothetical protein
MSNDSESGIPWEDFAYSTMIQNETFLRLLIKKGIITEEEYMEEAQEVYQEYLQNTGGKEG